MPRVVPSQIVEVIENWFSAAVKEADAFDLHGITNLSVSVQSVAPQVKALLDLLDHLPNELLAVEPKRFSNFILASAAMRSAVKRWELGTDSSPTDNRLQGLAGLPG